MKAWILNDVVKEMDTAKLIRLREWRELSSMLNSLLLLEELSYIFHAYIPNKILPNFRFKTKNKKS